MALPYEAIFLGLLIAYMIYSQWIRLDSRYPIAGALLLLVVAAVADALGQSGAANTLAIYVFFLLAGGVLLLLLDHVREERQKAVAAHGTSAPAWRQPGQPTAESPHEGQGSAQQAFNDLQ